MTVITQNGAPFTADDAVYLPQHKDVPVKHNEMKLK